MHDQPLSMVYRILIASFEFNEKLLDSLLDEHYTLTARRISGFLVDDIKISKHSMFYHIGASSFKDSHIYGIPHQNVDVSTLVTKHKKLVKDSLFLVQEINRLILTNKKEQLLYSIPKDALDTYTNWGIAWKEFVESTPSPKPPRRKDLFEKIQYYYTEEIIYGFGNN